MSTPPLRECTNPHCGNHAPPDRGGYCTACYWYRRRNHTNRPAHLVLRHYNRDLDRILATPELHA